MNAKPVTRRQAQKSAGFIIAQDGKKSDGEIPEAFRKWQQKARTSKKASGSGREEWSITLLVEVSGTEAISA